MEKRGDPVQVLFFGKIVTGFAILACGQAVEERGDPVQVLFLGTGSAEPSKYRGSAGLHVRLGPGRGFLLDAGEGSWGALVRHYGLEQARAEVRARGTCGGYVPPLGYN